MMPHSKSIVFHSSPGLSFCFSGSDVFPPPPPTPTYSMDSTISKITHFYLLLGPVACLSSHCLRSVYNIWNHRPNTSRNFAPFSFSLSLSYVILSKKPITDLFFPFHPAYIDMSHCTYCLAPHFVHIKVSPCTSV